MPPSVVIVGAGHAGFQLAAALRQERFTGRVVLLGDDPDPPYQRPPLSKAYMLGKADAGALHFRASGFFGEQSIELVTGKAAAIDRMAGRVHLENGDTVDYEHLVLALGARNRSLDVAGRNLEGVFGLRTLEDARRAAACLKDARRIVVCGAGFIGLEFATAARALGREVEVLEYGDRPMQRATSPAISRWILKAHRASGIGFRLSQALASIEGRAGRVDSVVSTSGETLPADLVMFGIGVVPNMQLAADAGLRVGNGIEVDSALLTSDSAISAVGDCASFPSRHAGRRIRLESVQNATDQARCVAARLAGRSAPFDALPWFWSDQGDLKLQIAGLSEGMDDTVVAGDTASRAFSVLCFEGQRLLAVESVNSPGDHMAARKILGRGRWPTPTEATSAGFDLRAFEAATR